ncbi:MAG TPA: tetratricopeptide repeat protein [Streptosporangiaceae bacterium]|nr:tetratricopeptide repeat protein [Streptosporangiaceae bacterium]
MIGSTGAGRRVVLWLIPVAALATIANEQLHSRWHGIFGVLIGIGWIALGGAYAVGLPQRRGRARRALERVIATGDTQAAATASLDLGAMLAVKDDVDGARVAWQRALDTGPPDIVAKAAFNLGLLHHKHDEPAAAIAAYQQAIGSDHPDYRPMAANNMAQVLQQIGDLDGARAAYQLAIDSGHPEQARIATRALAQMR